MSKNDQQGTPEVNTPTTPQQDGTPDQPDAAEDGKSKGNAEAARWRSKLRTAEAERDALAEAVETLQRQLIAGAMPHGSKLGPDALWLAGRKPGGLFENGQLDPDKLTAAVKEVHAELGVRFGPDPIPGQGGGSGAGLRDEPATLANEARKRRA
jgi:hypothetical protein